MNCRCDNCDWTGPDDDLNDVKDLLERVDPGGEMPAGECPQCGDLAYLDTPREGGVPLPASPLPPPAARHAALLRFAELTLDRLTEPDWSADTVQAIADVAKTLGLATANADGCFART